METGVLKGKHRRTADSTVLDDAVARQNTTTQLIAAVRRFGRDIPDGQDLVGRHAKGYAYTRTGKPDIAWDDQDAKDGLISALVTDVLALLAAVDPATLEGKADDAYALLALVAGQDVEPAEGSDGMDGRRRITRKVAPDRMISTVDPNARYAHKTQSRHEGGQWSSGPPLSSPAATDAFGTAASAGTTPGCAYGSRTEPTTHARPRTDRKRKIMGTGINRSQSPWLINTPWMSTGF